TAGDPISRFKLQSPGPAGWKDVPGLKITANSPTQTLCAFPAVRSDRLRLVVTATPGNISRIWEVEFYNPPEQKD
ncbi:MAG: hypothetical protein JSU94_04760, partial [Phycisphaerales bacterium]